MVLLRIICLTYSNVLNFEGSLLIFFAIISQVEQCNDLFKNKEGNLETFLLYLLTETRKVQKDSMVSHVSFHSLNKSNAEMKTHKRYPD